MSRAALIAVVLWATPATAGVEDWEVNEVLVSAGNNPAAQYIELRNEVGGCLFPSSRVEVRDSSGSLVDALGLVPATTCFGPDTLRVIATDSAELHFGVVADNALTGAIPAAAAQICFASSATRYDCVRYGNVTAPVVDFFGVTDMSATLAPPSDISLARIDRTHVVIDDWQLATPTPGAFNDGTPFDPPDAGPDAPDAAIPDAGPDAMPPPDAADSLDAAPEPDARNTRFLDLEAAGGADCGCVIGRESHRRKGATGLLLVVGMVLLIRSRCRARKSSSTARPSVSTTSRPRCAAGTTPPRTRRPSRKTSRPS